MDSSEFLKWGCLRYLSIVNVLPTVDGGPCAPSLEQTGVHGTEAKQCTAVDGDSSKNVF